MKNKFLSMAMIVSALFAGGTMLTAQEKEKSKQKPDTIDKATKSVDKKSDAKATGGESRKSGEPDSASTRRLPAGYGSLDLTDDQKEKIYKIRQDNAAKLAEIQKQIEALREESETIRSKMDKDFQAVLTSDQKKELNANREASAEARKDSEKQDNESKDAAANQSKAKSGRKSDSGRKTSAEK